MDQEKVALRRELGFWDALTIGAGTMIGAGIFLLAGPALSQAGPAAVLSYLLAGVVCVITAASAAELATGMPTSGGDYFFVSRSLGPALGSISGIGIWLSLTCAIAFYLFGFGEYLAALAPVPPLVGALVGGILLTILNVAGAKMSGRAQVVVVLILMVILGGFALLGLFHVDPANLTPFFPQGTGPILATTGLVFVSFLGFVKIAAVAEEIRDPARNLPRALIGSVILVTGLYILILFVVGGIFPPATIQEVRDPLTAAARLMLGTPGGWAIILAGLLATVSSANASIMAASRINLAMARDGLIPTWLSAVHRKLLTPHRAILATSFIALLLLGLDSLEDLAKLASVLQLYSYAALNLGAVALRASAPSWYRPAYRAPGFPLLPLLAAAGCVGIILVSGLLAQAVVVALVLLSLAWYFLWARVRMKIQHALPELRGRWGQLGLSAFFGPALRYAEVEGRGPGPVVRPLEPRGPRRIMVAVANPMSEAALLRIARMVAAGEEEGGSVEALHLIPVPMQTPLSEARDRLHLGEHPVYRELVEVVEREREASRGSDEAAMRETTLEVRAELVRDVFQSLAEVPGASGADLLLMGWHGGFGVGRIYDTPVQRVMANVETDFAVLKERNLGELRTILLPWGGGPHSRSGLEVGTRLARASGAALHVLQVVRPDVDPDRAKAALAREIEPVVGGSLPVALQVNRAESIADGIDEVLPQREWDLVVVGASRESRIRRVLFGSIPDRLADRAPCSVLLVRHYIPRHWTRPVNQVLKSIREGMGFTRSASGPG